MHFGWIDQFTMICMQQRWAFFLKKIIDYYLLFLFTEFDLEKERSVLDDQGVRIGENQENSQKNRRKLAETTRGISFISEQLNSAITFFDLLMEGCK